jgi:hypothetical protein
MPVGTTSQLRHCGNNSVNDDGKARNGRYGCVIVAQVLFRAGSAHRGMPLYADQGIGQLKSAMSAVLVFAMIDAHIVSYPWCTHCPEAGLE